MPGNVSIAYRGAYYAIGQGPQFYGIWPAAAPQAPPLEWWPLTPEGWTGAWSRFASIEAPGTIAPVTQQPAPDSGPQQPGPDTRVLRGQLVLPRPAARTGHPQSPPPRPPAVCTVLSWTIQAGPV